MSGIPALVVKDLRRMMASPSGLLVALAIPLAIAGTMALVFGGGGEDATPVLRLLVADLDKTALSNAILGASQNEEAARHMDVQVVESREEGLARLRQEEASALLVIPEGFAARLLDGETVSLEMLKNPAQSIMPIVAQQLGEVLVLYLSVGADLLGDEAPRLKMLLDGEGWDDAAGLASMATTLYARVESAGNLLLPPLIEVEKQGKKAEEGNGFNPISWIYPGMLILALLFVGSQQMRDLFTEREAGTLRRQLVSPLGSGQVLVSKILSSAAVVALAHVMLLLVGRYAFGVHWSSAGELAAVSILLVVAVTGFSALLLALARTERQADALSTAVVMVMAMAGGAFVPASALPGWMKALAPFTVNYWGHEALRALATGGGWDRIATHLQVLAGIAVASTILGALLLSRRRLWSAS